FGGKLKNSWIKCGCDLTERAGAEIRIWISGPETIGHVIRFESHLYTLALPQLKDAGQRRVELPGTGSDDVPWRHISECTQNRQCERLRIQIVCERSVSKRVAEYLLCALAADSAQLAVHTTGDRKVGSCRVSVDSRQLPTTRNSSQHQTGKPR